MNKRAYIFYLSILICGFIIAYISGVKLGSESNNNINEKTANAKVQEEQNESDEGYWVKAVDNRIYVYRNDCTTIIAETDIDISGFTIKEKNIINNGIYFENAEDLFNYLEANTS